MAEERHYQVVMRLGPLHTDAEARLKAAIIEKAANEVGAGPAVVVALEVAETSWLSLLGCGVCGSMVCQGPGSHAAEAPASTPRVAQAPDWLLRARPGSGAPGLDRDLPPDGLD